MKRASLRPFLELLENRLVPATVQLIGGELLISNPTITAGKATLTLTAVGPNQIKVQDGSSVVGSYTVGSAINVTGSSGNDSITLNLAGNTFTGNLFINTGTGNDTVNLNATGGIIGGNVTIQEGPGNDKVGLGATTGTLTVGGSITVLGGSGDNTVTFGNSHNVSHFQGSVNLVGENFITIGRGRSDTFGGNLTVTTLSSPGINLAAGTFGPGTISIAGSFQVTGGAADDFVKLGNVTIAKGVTANLGGSDTLGNELQLEDTTLIFGNLTYQGGAGSDFVDFAGSTIDGNVALTLGTGADTVAMSHTPTINGNLSITTGNGNDNFAPFGAIRAQVAGNMSFNLGNGNDTVTLLQTSSISGTLSFHTGNGNNSLTLNGAQTFAANIVFGSGNDTLTLGTQATLTGFADGDGGVNVFNELGSLGSPLTLQNF